MLYQIHYKKQAIAFTTESFKSAWMDQENLQLQIVTSSWVYGIKFQNEEELQDTYETIMCVMSNPELYRSNLKSAREARNDEYSKAFIMRGQIG